MVPDGSLATKWVPWLEVMLYEIASRSAFKFLALTPFSDELWPGISCPLLISFWSDRFSTTAEIKPESTEILCTLAHRNSLVFSRRFLQGKYMKMGKSTLFFPKIWWQAIQLKSHLPWSCSSIVSQMSLSTCQLPHQWTPASVPFNPHPVATSDKEVCYTMSLFSALSWNHYTKPRFLVDKIFWV